MAKAPRQRRSQRPSAAQPQAGSDPISFRLTAAQIRAFKALCGGRAVKFCGWVVDGKLIITEVTCMPPGYVPSNAVYIPPPTQQ